LRPSTDKTAPTLAAAPAHAGFIKNNLREYGMLLSLSRSCCSSSS
jgi:hypothetical protein